MSYAEAAFELRDVAEYLVASEVTMPFAGWPYAAILQRMKDEPTVKPLRLGEIVVEEFMRSFRSNNVALSILRPSKAAVLPDLIGPLRRR